MSKFRVLPLLLLLSACGEMPKMEIPKFDPYGYFSVYRQDIRQGNYVTQEMVSQLKVGQTREQVRFVLGTPLVTDPFHSNRWDYVYRLNDGKGTIQQRTLTVFFDADSKLARVGGDVLAADPNAPAQKAEVPKSGDAETPADKSADAAAATSSK